MNDAEYYAKIGLQAAKRAARKVVEQAHRDNRPIPVWDGEKVQHIIPPLPDEPAPPDPKGGPVQTK